MLKLSTGDSRDRQDMRTDTDGDDWNIHAKMWVYSKMLSE